MIVVASNLDLPIKLVLPSTDHYMACSLLGLGDMVIPGLHIMYARRFGDFVKTKIYFISNLIAYGLALIGCSAIVLITGKG